MNTLLFCAGGTAGHVFPACALSLKLKNENIKTILLTDKRGVRYVQGEFDEVIVLPISKLSLKFYCLLPYIFLRYVILLFKVNKVIVFGGYVSFVPLILSRIFRTNITMIQLDSCITRLNRWFCSYVHKVLYIFSNTNFEVYKPNYYLIGMPLRSGYEFSFKKHDQQNFIISVVGGSLGSEYWKSVLIEFEKMLDPEIAKNITIYIQTSEKINFLSNFKQIITEKFFDTRILFRNSHLILTRCGANSLSEISSVGRPSCLFPWPFAIENHQFVNAKNYSLLKGGILVEDNKEFYDFFIKLYQNEIFYYKICENASKTFYPFKKDLVNKLIFY